MLLGRLASPSAHTLQEYMTTKCGSVLFALFRVFCDHSFPFQLLVTPAPVFFFLFPPGLNVFLFSLFLLFFNMPRLPPPHPTHF